MGGCVTKNGAAAVAAELENATRASLTVAAAVKKGKTPANGETDNETPPSGQSLKERERRRLSLSQSGPARDDNADDPRGRLMITGPDDDMPRAVASIQQKQKQQEKQRDKTQVPSPAPDTNDEEAGCHPATNHAQQNYVRPDMFTRHLGVKTVGDMSSPLTSSNGTPFPATASAAAPADSKKCRRLSVAGAPSSEKQDNFEHKRQEVKSDTGYFDKSTLVALGIGYA